MQHEGFSTATIAERPDLAEPADDVCGAAWPTFMLQDDIVERHFFALYRDYPEFQFVLLEDATGRIAAVGNCVPVPYNGTAAELPDGGVDWILTERFERHKRGQAGSTLFALQIVVAGEFKGHRLSSECVKTMTSLGSRRDCRVLYAPVRPNLKARYPRTPMEHYLTWTDGADMPFDPWIRVHARLGARIVGVCAESMYIDGTVAEWEEWTGMQFPESGRYDVPEALVPVRVQREKDLGEYIEPNVWMEHRIR